MAVLQSGQISVENTQYLPGLVANSVYVMGPGQVAGACDTQVLESFHMFKRMAIKVERKCCEVLRIFFWG